MNDVKKNGLCSEVLGRLVSPVFLGLAMVLVAVVGLVVIPVRDTQARETLQINTQGITKTAYVVVRYGDNDIDVRAISFTGTISEWTALERAGLNPVGAGTSWGLMLCGINGLGQVNVTNDGCDNGSGWWGTKDIVEGVWEDNLGVSTEFSDNGHVSGFVWGDIWPSVNPPSGSRMKSAVNSLNWLKEQQDADGGYGDIGSSSEVLMAVAGNGCDSDLWSAAGGISLRSYMLAHGEEATGSAAGTGKLMVALTAAGEDVDTFLGGSLVTTMTGYYSPTTGAYDSGTSYDQGTGPHAWALLGMRAAGETVPVTATKYLTGLMQAEGCWEWSSGYGCDTNSTSLAIQALVATGISTDAAEVISGVTWLKAAQNSDGGFPYDPQSVWGTDSDTNSTAYVVQALLAADESAISLANGNPIDYLRAMQQSDGEFNWQDGVAGFGTSSTRQVIPALLNTPFPIERATVFTGYSVVKTYYMAYLPTISKD